LTARANSRPGFIDSPQVHDALALGNNLRFLRQQPDDLRAIEDDAAEYEGIEQALVDVSTSRSADLADRPAAHCQIDASSFTGSSTGAFFAADWYIASTISRLGRTADTGMHTSRFSFTASIMSWITHAWSWNPNAAGPVAAVPCEALPSCRISSS